MKTFLIYGSYGYTGQLIVEVAIQHGLRPILAGRNERKLRAQAESFGLEHRTFSLDDKQILHDTLADVEGVLHCAGPFVHTFRKMAEACLAMRCHYLDISGEILGFETLAKMDEDAKKASIMMMPGAGFDVVPTDCLALHLKNRLPSATHLKLYINSIDSGVSRGTARSVIENMHREGTIRTNHELVHVPPAWNVRTVDFGSGPEKVVSIGWGDVSTAYHSTGIPNIQVYMAFPYLAILFLRAMRVIGPVLYTRPAKGLLKQVLRLRRSGPTQEQRQKGYNLIVGEAVDGQNGSVSSKLKTPDGYRLTAMVAVAIMQKILNSEFEPGFQTPSMVYGPDFILNFDGIDRTDL
ncbi:MAG: saccharopine dehydrogenase NADP-binding domain-containing protein [Anaerolineae bacterium]|nr:saccharopine dehydrogenase NADP-binding domain-containing protein [Anaerolineae bacterium]MDK1080840.1 saccharopine dehydrogenase NADP-binding domain-containing protein [Anaerolineae bacterium]MDK1117404.1 saccharopine dehydrogenase NADP-binding domain-containing protein [Anaerolineae bacterium]